MTGQVFPAIPAGYVARVGELLSDGQRKLLGLVGPPGAGKSMLALALHHAFPEMSQIVPMDGYQLANVELSRLGRAERKGAPDTFDSAGYAAMLWRLRQQGADDVVYAPGFRREIEEPVAGAVPVFAQTRLVITVGNDLLLDSGHWASVAGMLDEVWYVDVDDVLRTNRLTQRHEQFGRSRRDAMAWVSGTDEPNARLIATTKPKADLLFRWDNDPEDPSFQPTSAAPLLTTCISSRFP